jgi:hypothetical protein
LKGLEKPIAPTKDIKYLKLNGFLTNGFLFMKMVVMKRFTQNFGLMSRNQSLKST